MTAVAVPVSGAVCRLLDGPSPVETERAAEIDAAWRAALSAKPRMFNGRILLGERVAIEDGVLEIDFRECAFATLVWLLGEGASERRLSNVFGVAAVVSRDGAALLGRMGPHTAHAGQVYFPCGTPDLADIVGDGVDIEGSMARELAEETGLAAPVVRPGDRLIVAFAGPMVGVARRFETDLSAEELEVRANAFLAATPEPELDRIVMARAIEDVLDETPAYLPPTLAALLKR